MARTYKRISGKKSRATINLANLQKALEAVRKGMTVRAAGKKYSINYSSLSRRNRNPAMHHRGGIQTALPPDLEQSICNRIITCASWGYPLSLFELQQIISQYLNASKKNIPRFTNNIPGIDYLKAFMKRHKDQLSIRLCRNIKRSRAAVNVTTVSEYFEELSTSLHAIPPQNIFNYDETNFVDDPGCKKVMCRRQAKYVERIMNTSKTGHSVMFCASATGELLPIYVVYKATNLYNKWTEGGPPHTRYNRSKSGWFDSTCFSDWIKTVIIPRLRNIEGTKVLIGDNLSSHISLEVIQLCELYDIKFVFLPPNSTHMLQPLDVAVYAPLKRYWRQTLTKWKQGEGKTQTSLPKSTFPRLLTDVMERVTPTLNVNVLSGFKTCGIHPIDLRKMLSRLPETQQKNIQTQNANIEQQMDNTFIQFLQSMQPTDELKQNRKKKLKVTPGKSVSAEDLMEAAVSRGEEPGTSGTQQQQKKPRGRPPKHKQQQQEHQEQQQEQQKHIEQEQAQQQERRKSQRARKLPAHPRVSLPSSSEEEEDPFATSGEDSDYN